MVVVNGKSNAFNHSPLSFRADFLSTLKSKQ
jgi:hypothetical protein